MYLAKELVNKYNLFFTYDKTLDMTDLKGEKYGRYNHSVMLGKHMSGHYGNESATVLNQLVVAVDVEKNQKKNINPFHINIPFLNKGLWRNP